MPRTGGGVYVKPFPDVTSGTTIASAVHNGIVSDVETDLNAPRPIIAGGTGATTAAIARTNLGAETALQTITNFDAAVWQPGSFFAASGATAGPPSGGTTSEAFYGTFYGDTVNGFVEARGLTNGLNYVRRKTGTWSAWALDGSDKLSNTGGTITGSLTVTGGINTAGLASSGDITVYRSGAPTTGYINFGSGGGHYLGFDGANFAFVGGGVYASSFNGALNGNATSANSATNATNATNASFATNAGHATNADSATTAGSASTANTANFATNCTNATNATNASNASTANYATTAGSLSGGSITVGDGGVIEGPYYIDLKYPGHSGEDFDGRIIASSDHGIHLQSANGVVTIDNQTRVNGGMVADAYRQRQGQSGGFSGNPSHQWFNICIANTGAAFEFWSNDTNYGSIFMSCDYRIKKDVAPLPSTWAQVKALKPISYTFNNYNGAVPDGVTRWGFLAHELQGTLIESAANGYKDQPNVVQTPTPITIIAALARALQEAMARIEALEAAG